MPYQNAISSTLQLQVVSISSSSAHWIWMETWYWMTRHAVRIGRGQINHKGLLRTGAPYTLPHHSPFNTQHELVVNHVRKSMFWGSGRDSGSSFVIKKHGWISKFEDSCRKPLLMMWCDVLMRTLICVQRQGLLRHNRLGREGRTDYAGCRTLLMPWMPPVTFLLSRMSI